ncbi:hypothetical protein EV13_1034 [Prochlorococcus sp. MIT 0702]|nr:hypothetical protein EV12_1073 [Prochlorococcus sp. MIT 0701]KGG29567.1 hypothetical protein EV13_1034 [Prochlorococcus sp. MIT 0702]KGG36063.1 hypothetical protein EV14_0470 [Prochlorococcus sp. MIT 0703]
MLIRQFAWLNQVDSCHKNSFLINGSTNRFVEHVARLAPTCLHPDHLPGMAWLQ